MSAKLVELQAPNIGDLSAGLRRLADAIDAGEYGDAKRVAWVIEADDITTGMLGRSASALSEGHMLLSLGMRQLEMNALE